MIKAKWGCKNGRGCEKFSQPAKHIYIYIYIYIYIIKKQAVKFQAANFRNMQKFARLQIFMGELLDLQLQKFDPNCKNKHINFLKKLHKMKNKPKTKIN